MTSTCGHRSRSLGSAHGGTGHWWAQRVSAVALLLLGVWFLGTVSWHPLKSLSDFQVWLGAPYRCVLMILFLITGFYHGYLGVQVIIEDYVHGRVKRTFLLVGSKFICIGAAVAGIFSVIKLAFLP